MKRIKKLTALVLSLILTLSLVTPAIPAAQAAGSGTTYYVSTLNGSDGNNGTSQATAFYSLSKINSLTLDAGDQVLLERGSVFENEYLHIKGSGAEGSPIVIDAYGTGDKPLINTNGNGIWYQNYGTPLDSGSHVWRGYVSSCILLFDVEYVEVNNLAMTNWGGVTDGTVVTGEKGYSWGEKMNRTGVAVVTQNIGTADHIYLKNLDIENIYGNVYDKHMNNGGIYFTVAKPHDESATGISRYHGVLIEGNYLKRTSRWGIAAAYTAYHAQFTAMAISDETCQKYGATDVVIRGNYLEEVGGDPITTMYAFEPLIEYNVSHRGSREMNTTIYTEPGSRGGRVAAGIWPWKCKTALFQYNECYDMLNAKDGNGDAQAWDADSGDSTIYQYNYSAGNTGGCVMACLGQAYNTVFRYNISYKDGEGTGILNPCGAPNGKYYNNTFIVAETAAIIRHDMAGGTPHIENNIFYGLGTARAGDWYHQTANAKYDNNLYYNFTDKPSGDAAAVQVATSADIFVAPPVGPTAPKSTIKGAGQPNIGWTHDWATEFNMFKLKDGAPAINAGKSIDLFWGLGSDHGVDSATKDFYDTALDASHDIGAHDTATPDLKLASAVYTVDQTAKTMTKVPNGLTVMAFLGDITTDNGVTAVVKKSGATLDGSAIVDMDCVVVLSYNGTEATYTFIKDADKAIKTSTFELEKDKTSGELKYQINAPFGDGFPLTLADFLAGVTVASTATAKVYSGDSEITSGNIADGMTLRVTAQDETTQNYVIKHKNVYNHSSDFVKKPVQGNVWYAQTKTNNAYTDITGWDSEYNCWNGGDFSSVEHYSICGKISANSTSASTSMAFRAPVDGGIQISFDTSTWPVKFRVPEASGNAGTVSLLITKNGVQLPGQLYELPKDSTPLNISAFSIAVSKGDMIRFEAQCVGSISKGGFSMVPVITYVYLDTEAPTAPTDVAASNVTKNSAALSWTASTDNTAVTKYVVSYTPTGGAAATVDVTGATTCTLTGLAEATEYTAKVTACDAAGNHTDSTSITFRTRADDEQVPTQPGRLTVADGDLTETTAKLTWSASADNVAVTGYKVYLGNTLMEEVNALEYTFTGLSPWTEYTAKVSAVDAVGNESTKAEVTFKTKDTTAPDTPTEVAAGTVTKNSAVITWTASEDNVAVTGYEVSDGAHTYAVSGGATATYTFSGLTAGTDYTVSVYALDAAGNKSEAGTVDFTTEESEDITPPAVPQTVAVSDESATGATVTWDAVEDDDLDGYTVYWTDGTTPRSATVAVGTQAYAITGLRDLTDYTVTVDAYDTSGNHSETSAGETFTTLDGTAPSVPVITSAQADDHESATVVWSTSTDNSGTVAKYVVTLKEGNNVVGTPADVTGGTTHAFTGLEESTTYTVSIVAMDGAGNSSAAGAMTFTTPAAPDTQPPTKPANLVASGKTMTTATVTWDASTDNVGVVKYVVTYGPTGGETATVEVSDATTCALRQLTAGTEYTVVVAAYDAADNHSQSDPITFETEPVPPEPDTEAPGVPSGLTVSGVTTTGAVLTWTAATDNVGVAKYLIYNGENLVTETTATTYTLSGLTAGTSYTFKVIAVDTSDNESDPVQVSFATQTESSGPPPSTGGSSGSSSGSTTEKNEDGSTTTTVTDKKTGTVTKTTKRPDGSRTVVETKKDGTVTTNDVRKDGVTVEAVTTPDKTTTAAVTVPTAVGKTTVRVPAPAVTPGTVAVLVKEDGTEEVIKLSVALNGSVVFPLAQSAQIKLVDNSKSFSDVAENSYYRSAVDFVTARDLFRGVSNNAFAPELTVDRGMLVTVLHRLSSGQDLAAAVEAAGKTDFADVESGAWYAESVNWAVKNGVTSGTGAGFAPQAELSREQLAVFLYNYAGKPLIEETYRFADSGKISPWAVQAVNWAIANGILTAGDDSRVNPASSASRGDTAMMLQNFVKYLAG